MKQNKFPPGWDEKHIQSIISDYKQQTEDEAVTEDEAASQNDWACVLSAANGSPLSELGRTAVCEWILREFLVDSQ